MITLRLKREELALHDLLKAKHLLPKETESFDKNGTLSETMSKFIKESLCAHSKSEDEAIEKGEDAIHSEFNMLRDTIYTMLPMALVGLQLFDVALQALSESLANAQSRQKKSEIQRQIKTVTQAASKFPNAGRIRSTERLPWDRFDLRRLNTKELFKELEERMEKASGGRLCLRTVAPGESSGYDGEQQVGVFVGKRQKLKACESLFDLTIDMVNAYLAIPGHHVCDHCTKSMDVDSDTTKLTSCSSCSTTYCSIKCRDFALNNYHKVLCRKDIGTLTSHLKLDTTKSLIPLLILRIFAMAKSRNVHPLSMPEIRGLVNMNLAASSKRPPFDKTTIDIYDQIVNLVSTNEGTKNHWDPSIDFWVFMTLTNVLSCNTFATRNPSTNKSWKVHLFPLVALINHSCKSNAEVLWPALGRAKSCDGNPRLGVRSECDLEEDVEVTISYVDGNLGKKERMELLESGWGFTCRCVK
ncbi:hypothetical protein HDU76_013947, partial [Blyttiomyces sp. JEL0837]